MSKSQPEAILRNLPQYLQEKAFQAGKEAAWEKQSALEVIESLSQMSLAVCGIEIWLPSSSGPEIPSPYIYTWTAEEPKISDSWRQYVVRTNLLAAGFVRTFEWDEQDNAYSGRLPWFNFEAIEEGDVG